LPNIGPNQDITPSAANVTITEPGDYSISYVVNADATPSTVLGSKVSAAIAVNGASEPASISSATLSTATDEKKLVASIIKTLDAGDEVTLVLSADQETEVGFDQDVSAALKIVKLD
jgi:hypothetical protein